MDLHNRCPHVVTLEETTSEWAVLHGNLTHTCPKAASKPMSDAEKALTCNRCTTIPDQLLGAVNPAEDLRARITWEYQDIRNQFAASADEIAYDATGFLIFLIAIILLLYFYI